MMPSTPALGWVPFLGDFETGTDQIVFHGKRIPLPEEEPPTEQSPVPERKDQATFGLLFSNRSLSDGRVSMEVEFTAVNKDTVFEIAVAYDANADHLVTAGLGGPLNAMFGIREYNGPPSQKKGWWSYQARGSHDSLRAGQKYVVAATFQGANVLLEIDGVVVASAEVTSPSGRPRQIGLLCRGDHEIVVTNIQIGTVKPKAFCVMQFGRGFDELYLDVIREVCSAYEINVIRADEVMGPGLIIGDITREINESQLVIADISAANSNVYFEVGYALALSKPTILLAKRGTPLPFDVAGFRVLFYEDSIGGKNKLEQGLRMHLDAILSR